MPPTPPTPTGAERPSVAPPTSVERTRVATFNRKVFFDVYRTKVGPIRDPRVVRALEGLLDEIEHDASIATDLRFAAYLLATAKHETGIVRNGADMTFQPIEEVGSDAYLRKYEPHTHLGKVLGNRKPGDGILYKGRGLVQLTGRANYEKMGNRLNLPLVSKPHLALDPHTAYLIASIGMLEGTFTGKRLSTYFTAKETRWKDARRIINGTDRASTVALYAEGIHKALTLSGSLLPSPTPPKV